MEVKRQAMRNSLEFFSTKANMRAAIEGEAGRTLEDNGTRTRGLGNLDEDELKQFKRGATLAVEHQKNAAVDFEGCDLHLGVYEFAPNLPLPLHSHSVDCMYLIQSGSMIMGNKTLLPGDGFLARADQPYGFSAGPDGLTFVEFTNAPKTDITIRERHIAGWTKRVEKAVGTDS